MLTKIKNKHIFFWVMGILMVSLSMALFAGFYISYQLTKSSTDEYYWGENESATYHVMILLDGANQAYSEEFIRGVDAKSEKYRVATEIISIEGANYRDQLLENMQLALYNQVDGLIIHAYYDAEVIAMINKLSSEGIAVITMNEDLPASQRITYVGVNRYTIGEIAAQAMIKSVGTSGKIAVIEPRSYEEYPDIDDSLLVLGFKDILKKYPDISLEHVLYTEEGVLSAEIIATNLMKTNPDINGIFCTNTSNTLGVVQVLVDNNLVSQVSLIGYGDEVEILESIKKGNIIEASIVTDYRDIGEKVIDAFYEYKTSAFVSNYFNTSIQVIEQSNVDTILREKSEENAKTQ
ncbi:substrate-binding domain-containing protein [Vallitaleaceae bacterium 9-2]